MCILLITATMLDFTALENCLFVNSLYRKNENERSLKQEICLRQPRTQGLDPLR